MTCEGSGQTETCNQRDGHVGWLICPVHGAEIRAMARSISAQQPQPGGSGAGSTDRMILTPQAIIIRDLRADLAAARNDSLGLETRIATLQGMLEAAQAEIERLRESQSRIIDGWYDWDRQLREARAEIAALKKDTHELRMVADSDEFDAFERLLKDARATIERQNAVIEAAGMAALNDELTEAAAEIKRLRKRIWLPCEWNHCVGECRCLLDAGRPTTFEAALVAARATIERQNAVIAAARALIDHDCAYCVASWCDERDHVLTDRLRNALDRATTEDSRVPGPNHDHTDTENADGPS